MGTQNCVSETVEDGISSYHLPRANYIQLFPTHWYFEQWHYSIRTMEMGKSCIHSFVFQIAHFKTFTSIPAQKIEESGFTASV